MPDLLPEPLRRLAQAHSVVTEFHGFDGVARQIAPATAVAVLAALGVDASGPEAVERALADAEDAPWRRALPPCVVVRAGDRPWVGVHVVDGDPVIAWVELEDGDDGDETPREWPLSQVDHWVEPRMVDGRAVGRATFALPGDLPTGYHRLRVSTPHGESACPLIVTPARLELPAALADGGQAWGLMAQLYSVRSRRSWGVGDLADLGDLGWLAGRRTGADFVLVNPLLAAEPTVPMTPSPYLPTTRRFVNPLYLRVEDIRETAYLPAGDRALVQWQADDVAGLDLDARTIDRDAVWTAKRAALEVVFAAPRSAARQTAFAEFRAEQGPGLEDFATWCALAEHFGTTPWPAEAADPRSPLVARLREALAPRIEFHCWLQWQADEQLAAAQRAALDGGMRIGIMHDLAVGVHPAGADAWALRDVLAPQISVGAPPDMYNQQGQDWSQPPWRPDALAAAGYEPYRAMVRMILRHAGALRIDHVIGLFRLWWIPRGASPQEGAYVRYDHDALIGILCLEAQRAGALVIGEDLGTFEPWVRDYLTDRGVLGTSVLWFEREGDAPIPPERYRRLCLATVTTHDLPPTAAYVAGEQVDLRDRLGLLAEPVEVVRAQARRELDAMLALLRSRDLVTASPSEGEVVEALHRLLLATPSALLGVSLADAVGERRAQNQPGTDTEYPNWKVPLADAEGRVVLLEDLFDHPRVRAIVGALAARR